MPWPVHPTGFFGAQGDNDTYRIERSLRFNSADSAYLNRTFSSGNRKTWTWSGWIKRTTLGTTQRFFTVRSGNDDTTTGEIAFETTNQLMVLGWSTVWKRTSQVFRDIAGWYHFVVVMDTTQATANNRVRIYVNGSEVTSFETTNNPTQNADLAINQNLVHYIGTASYGDYSNFYLTEVNFIDGQALTPSSFGETDAITGRWKAKAYSGTYGTNGFYLKFADNSGTTATTLGKDSSGNGNNWTPNNFSVTAGAGNDSLVDSPTNYGTDTGVGGEVRGNYCIINASFNLNGGVTSDGNLVLTSQNAGGTSAPNGTIGVKSGKWYFEMQAVSNGGFGQPYAGINNGSAYGRYIGNGSSSPFSTYGTYGVAFDVDAGKLWLTDSTGAWVSSGSPSTGANPLETFSGGLETFPYCAAARTSGNNASAIGRWNFGQRPFAYTAPSGFKALCTTNLPTPTIQKPSSYMDVVTYTGNGSTQTISGLNFSPDLVWLKSRSSASWWHILVDSVRGAGRTLSSNVTNAEIGSGSDIVSSLNSNGFSLNVSPNATGNENGTTYVAWAWDEAPIAGMDIVSYTGNGTNRTIAHNLGVAPKMIIVKNRNFVGSTNWCVYHSSLSSPANSVFLDTTDAQASYPTVWNSTAPTSSVFSVGTNLSSNGNGNNMIAYLFAEVEGFSKFGSYTGNGSSDGPFVWCGFRPRWVMVKRTDTAGFNWVIWDTARSTSNQVGDYVLANAANAENNVLGIDIDALSNGFKLRDYDAANSGNTNISTATYIFAAFAESAFKYSRAR